MRMETEYLVSAKTAQAAEKFASFFGHHYEEWEGASFEDYDTQVFDVMEKVIKLVHYMEKDGQKEDFSIVGICETDWDCTLFSIEYAGEEPLIKASLADPEEDEEKYERFSEADWDDIPKILKRNKGRTFKQAIKDELPLGGFLDVSYEEWCETILAE